MKKNRNKKEDPNIAFLDLLEKIISNRIKNNWNKFHPKKALSNKDLEKLVAAKLAIVLSWSEDFSKQIKSKSIEIPEEPFGSKEEYIEWVLDQFEKNEYQKDLKEVKTIFSGKIK